MLQDSSFPALGCIGRARMKHGFTAETLRRGGGFRKSRNSEG
jgi:hypothetical protein